MTTHFLRLLVRIAAVRGQAREGRPSGLHFMHVYFDLFGFV